MSKQEALYQSLASCGAALVIYNGILHLFVAETLFPFGPALFHGHIAFMGLGVIAIVAGLSLLGGILRFYVFSVVLVSLITAVAGFATMIACQALYNKFNVFALTVASSGIIMAYFYRKAVLTSHR